jgi:hypothetical protein
MLRLTFQFLAFIFRRVQVITETPRTLGNARLMLVLWIFALGNTGWAFITEIFNSAGWSWWYLYFTPITLFDLVMVRSATLGYLKRRNEAQDRAEFERITADF